MKTIYNTLRSAGVFVMVAILTLIVIIVTLSQIKAKEADRMVQQLVKLNYFQGDLAYFLGEMEAYATYYRYSGDEADFDGFLTNRDEMAAIPVALDEDWLIDLTPQEAQIMAEFNNKVDELVASASQMQQAVQAGDERRAAEMMRGVGHSTSEAKQVLGQLVAVTRGELNLAAQELPRKQGTMVTRVSVLIGVLIVLAVWGFVVSGQVRQPILALTNATMAISGGQFQPAILADAQTLAPGLLARKLETLAEIYATREADLEQELAMVQQGLRASRRERMVNRVESTATEG